MSNYPVKFDIETGNELLTPVEQFTRGATVPEKYIGEPNLPMVLATRLNLTQNDIARINAIRQQLMEVEGMAISISYGVEDPIRNRARIRLSELDPLTGKARNLPELSGIERSDGKIDRRNLKKYSLTEEARKHLMEAFPSLNEEFMEDRPSRK